MLKLPLLIPWFLTGGGWLWLPFQQSGERCEEATREIAKPLQQTLSQQTGASFISDLDPYPCAAFDCALLRARRASASVALYGRVECGSRLLKVEVTLLRIHGEGEALRAAKIVSFSGAVNRSSSMQLLIDSAQTQLIAGGRQPPPAPPPSLSWSAEAGPWLSGSRSAPGVSGGLSLSHGAPWGSLRLRLGVAGELLEQRDYEEQRLRLEGWLQLRQHVRVAGPWLALGLGVGKWWSRTWTRQSIRDEYSLLQLDFEGKEQNRDGFLLQPLSAVGYRIPSATDHAVEIGLHFSPGFLEVPPSWSLRGAFLWH